MSDNRLLDMLGDDNGHEDEAIASLSQLARAHGAESRAADIVADKVLRGRFRFAPAIGWLEWSGKKWDDDDISGERVVEVVRQFIDATEKDYRREMHEADEAAQAIGARALDNATDDQLKNEKGKDRPLSAVVALVLTDEEAKEFMRLSEAADKAKRQADIWLNLLSAGKISSITKLCRGMDGIITRSTDFDAHPDLLNCENGVVDLQDGELRPHDPDLLLTHMAGGEYIPGAKSTLWDKALKSIPVPAPPQPGEAQADVFKRWTEDNLQYWFQTRVGQAATGHTPDDDSLIVSSGGGENGKSAVMSAIMRALGSYARLISHRVLIAQPGQHPTELMDLRGLRLALLEETPEEGRLDTHQLKTTIGTPYITARRMRRDDVTFKTSHSLFVNTNFLPQVDTTDHGTWRRLKAMPWPYRFRKPGQELETDFDREGDLTLKPKLATNPTVPAAVLAWIVEGAKRWYAAERISPQDPKGVVEATDNWRSLTDVGFQFASERLIASPKHFITADEMRKEFTEFLQAQGKREWSGQTINTRLPDSMSAAGITTLTATPAKAAKVRQGDTESKPPNPGWIVAGGQQPEAPAIKPGKVVRMWRGVRFRTEAERGQKLTAVS